MPISCLLRGCNSIVAISEEVTKFQMPIEGSKLQFRYILVIVIIEKRMSNALFEIKQFCISDTHQFNLALCKKL